MPEIINIIATTQGKEIQLEVEPYHTIKQVIELVISQLKLGRREWVLLMGSKEFTAADTRTLGEAGIRNGDTLYLVPPPIFSSETIDLRK